MNKMGRAEALRKCLIVFDALRRVSSKGNAGLEAMPGAEESFQVDTQICEVLREWLREMESGAGIRNVLQGNPLITEETLAAAQRMDEAREKLIGKMMQPEPDAPKVVELREWQRIAAERPPERLDFDE